MNCYKAIDPDRAARERQLACVVNSQGFKPDYPMEALRNGVQGRVLVEMRFVNADGPPEIKLLAPAQDAVFGDRVVLLVPCGRFDRVPQEKKP